MKNLITLFISALFLISCGNSKTESKSDSKENIIDLKTIIGKSETEIEKVLGKAENSEKVSPNNTPCKDIPCNKKSYQKNKFEIVFIDGKSDWITINNTSNFEFDSENIALLGLLPTEPNYENNISKKWNDIENINDITYFNNGENKIDYIYIKTYTK
jgi:hypothetical protein